MLKCGNVMEHNVYLMQILFLSISLNIFVLLSFAIDLSMNIDKMIRENHAGLLEYEY